MSDYEYRNVNEPAPTWPIHLHKATAFSPGPESAEDWLANTLVYCIEHDLSVEATDAALDEVEAMLHLKTRPTIGFYQRLSNVPT